MKEAIEEFVHEGDVVFIGGYFARTASSAIHEITRQKKRDLTIVRSNFSEDADLLIGTGCVSRVFMGAYAVGIGMGISRVLRRAVEKGIPRRIEIEDYTNLSLPMMLLAGAMGIPFLPVRDMQGTDLLNYSSFLKGGKYKRIECPFTGEKLIAVPALKPDIAIVHVQQADAMGNAQIWGIGGDCKYGSRASRKVIVTTERIVDRETIGKDPDRTIIPSFMVNAVVEDPWGSHPYYVPGFYDQDQKFRDMYFEASSTVEGFEDFTDEWVYGVKDRAEYIDHYTSKYGHERLEVLKAKPCYSSSVNYGY
jgi:glutaconate CoA-transferase subunit A